MKPDLATCQGAQFLPYGLVSGFEVELGHFSLKELREVKGPMGLPIERDLYYEPKSLKELIDLHRKQRGEKCKHLKQCSGFGI